MKEVLSYGHIEGLRLHPHKNRGMEISLVDRGHLFWAVDERPEELNAGDIFFTLPWQTHGSTAIREPKNKIYYVLFQLDQDYQERPDEIHFSKASGFSLAEQKMLSEIFCKTTRHAWNASPLLKQFFPELIKRLQSKSRMDVLSSATLLRSIIVELARVIKKGGEYKIKINASAKRAQTFLQSLSNDLEQPWTLNQMAESCDMKRTHFTNITRQLTGYAPLIYLGLLRFSRACHLLVDTDMPITEIAFECGYSSSQYFSDSFRKRAKMTPSHYRRDAPAIKEIFDSSWKNPEWRSIEEEQVRRTQFKDA